MAFSYFCCPVAVGAGGALS